MALNDVIRDLKLPSAGLPESWAGDASSAFGGFMSALISALGSMVGEMGQTQQILEDAAKEAAFAHDTIVMIIREVVEWVAGNLLVDALTLGLATGVEALGTAGFLAEKVDEAEQAASKLASVYRALRKIVDNLKDRKEEYEGLRGLERLKKFTSLGKDLMDDVLGAGKLRNLRMLGDGKLADAAKWLWGAGTHAEGIPQTLELGTKAGVLTTTAVKAGVVGTVGLTGLSSDPGLTDLGKDVVTGNLGNVSGNAQGAAEALHLSTPHILRAPPVSRIEDLLNKTTPSPQEP